MQPSEVQPNPTEIQQKTEPNPLTSTPQKPKKKIWKVLKIIVAIILGVILLFIIGVFIFNYFNKQLIIKDVSGQRSEAEKKADASVQNLVNKMINSGVSNRAIATSKTDVCYVTHSDAGWFANNWYQDCYLRYIVGFETQLSLTQFAQKISSISQSHLEYPPCVAFSVDNSTQILYRPANTPRDQTLCEIPNQLQGIGSVRGPIVLDKELSVKAYKSFDPANINNSQNQVWVIHDEYYYREDLGCGIGLFCENPRSKPYSAK